MRVPLVVLLFALAAYGFQAPKIDVEEKQAESHPHIGRFVELREHERLVLRCHGRFDDLTFKFPNLEGNVGYDKENFADRVEEEIDNEFGDTVLTISDVRESDTGTYACVSEEHQSLNDTIHVFVHGSNVFLPLTVVMGVSHTKQFVVPCKTTQFVDRNDIALYADGKIIKSASKEFDQRVGFKITPKLYDSPLSKNVNFECKHTKEPRQAFIYINTVNEEQLDLDNDFQFYWDKGFDWPHVGYNYSLTCHLGPKGEKTFEIYRHKLHIECDRCSNTAGNHIYVENNKARSNQISVAFHIEHLELEDSINYKCVWRHELDKDTWPPEYEYKSIDYKLHVAPTRPQIKVIERSQHFLRLKEHSGASLSAKFAIYPSDEEKYVATWSRTYNSSIKEGPQSETIITDEIRKISAKRAENGIFVETLDLSSAAMTTSMSGTYRLSISHMNTSQSVQWEVAIENDKPDVQITVREPSSFIVFNQQFYPPDTNLHIDCVSISIPPSTDVVFEQKNKISGEFEEIDRSLLMNAGGTFEQGFIWNMTLDENTELRCTSTRNGEKHTTTKSVFVAAEAIRVYPTVEKSPKATETESKKPIYEGDNVNLTCVIPSGVSNWEVSWKFNDNDLPSTESVVIGHSKHVVLGLTDITTSSSGKYSCIVQKDDDKTVQDIVVRVESISKPFPIKADSRSAVKVNFDETFELDCGMTGTPEPEFQWYKNGEVYKGERTGSLLKVTRARAEDDGQFECQASNRAGTTSKFIEVQVEGAPKGSWFYFYWTLALFLIAFLGVSGFLVYKLRASKRITKQKDIQIKELYKSMLESNPGPVPDEMKDLPIEERTYYLPYNTDYEIDLCNLEQGALLGEGNFGTVRKGLLRMADPKSEIEAKTQLPVAIKSAKNLFDMEVQKMMADELKIMNFIPKHPNVLSLVGAVTTGARQRILIVTEFIEGGSLENFLRNHQNGFDNELVEGDAQIDNDSYMVPNSATKKSLLPDDNVSLCTSDLLSIGLQIANGMEFLASIPCVHRDLACRNVFITQSKVIRIADFGLAKRHDHKNYYRTKNTDQKLPVRWMPIEAIDWGKYTQKSDVWSFGICLYEIFTLGGRPYPNVENFSVVEYVRSGKRNPQPPYCPDNIFQLMRQCWESSPEKRPTFTACLQYLKEHINERAPELLQQLDDKLHIEKKEQLALEEWTKKSRSGGRFIKKNGARKQQEPEEQRYLIVESHA